MLSEKIFKRIEAQANEAKALNLTKTANGLTQALNQESIREQTDYNYSINQLQNDVELLLWKSAMRAADYFEAIPDAETLRPTIESFAFDFISEYRKIARANYIGPNEPKLPGESK